MERKDSVSTRPIPGGEEIPGSHGIVGVRQGIIQFDGFAGVHLPILLHFLRRNCTAYGEEAIVVCETTPGSGIVRLKLDGLLEVSEAGLVILAEPEVTPA
jgi:hypothetical protein